MEKAYVGEEEIRNVITQLGAGNSYRGYEFAVYGIGLALENPERLTFISKGLYIDIAAHFHTSWKCVERDLRTLIDVIWRTDNQKLLFQICGYRRIKKPKNKMFFELMYQFFMKIECMEAELCIEKARKNAVCPGSAEGCRLLEEAYRENDLIRRENLYLIRMISWMYDLIWYFLDL